MCAFTWLGACVHVLSLQVMLSRAQHGMYVFGNSTSLKANAGKQPFWPQVCDLCHVSSAGTDQTIAWLSLLLCWSLQVP